MSIALIAICVIFVLGYLVIALEHPLELDKAATALFIGVACWTIYAMNVDTLLGTSFKDIPEHFQRDVAAEHLKAHAAEQAKAAGPMEADAPPVQSKEEGPDAGDAAGGLTPASSRPALPETSHGDESADVESPGGDVRGGDSDRDESHGVEGHDADGHSDAHFAGDPLDHAPDLKKDAEYRLHLKRDFMLHGKLFVLLAEISEILFFLLGAMTIVELVDAHEGFSIITSRITAEKKTTLLWMTSWLAFFMSAVLDNLTSTIVMVSLIRKLISDDSRLLFVGMVVVAANAGGAWTVIGDVTTTMLWIGGKLSVIGVIKAVLLPSIVCLLLPLLVASLSLRGQRFTPRDSVSSNLGRGDTPFTQKLFLGLGLLGLLSVPVFKLVTHLPPFIGMLGSLSVLWLVSDYVRRDLDEDRRTSTNVVHVLRKVDSASILFFMGILLAVGALQATGVLESVALKLDKVFGNRTIIAILTGLFSAIVDNVPLVAAGINMYTPPIDDPFWLLLAYTAGTGGSCLIIGSAAGVAAMGLEKITFGYYLKKIAPLALLGYAAGVAVFIAQWKYFPWLLGL